ncbi:ornithine carbamoyltransferase [Campylobacter blaseri]|uniref:Ornithine carbamoyltransferase n=1 Tax=Campylobacter blaseri TaxID=2042961 RepID=A0A2P8R0L5_9BACT|nr:ornithine carbamoyltransferase [Campylobacter blaseri]PSM52037.1 ornithine carbamoyltransferase [Campylobacter blaseri]PSM53822.1 ornithine carbamoyltransferase [Campylobacter blaseri]QKF85626.1 ornithine carbamoyltransferase [Campylobacter blaseri]
MRHFLTLNDFSKDEIIEILNLSKKIKNEAENKIFKPYLEKQTLAMIFEKNSTRTRVSFEVGMYQLGGHALFLSKNDMQLNRGELLKDTALVISSMCDIIMARVYRHKDLKILAKYSKVPVINGLSDLFHPAQLMADLLTLMELGFNLEDLKVAYIGDANNMSNSWLMAASKLGFELKIATPKNYEIDSEILKIALDNAKQSGAKISVSNNPKKAIELANVATTDTWMSMGNKEQKEEKIKHFKGFCVDNELMKLADREAKFLHCLPVYRDYEVSKEVFEKHSKEIFLEAENRLHAQKGLLVWLNEKRKNNVR